VLVVDDNRDAAEMLASMLSAWAQDSVTAFDGPSAIELGARFQPDVVLLDLGMPKMDGYETARRNPRAALGAELHHRRGDGLGTGCGSRTQPHPPASITTW
jgi:CheY-like chemotaxis protein